MVKMSEEETILCSHPGRNKENSCGSLTKVYLFSHIRVLPSVCYIEARSSLWFLTRPGVRMDVMRGKVSISN